MSEHSIRSHGRAVDGVLIWTAWDCLTCGMSFASESAANDHRVQTKYAERDAMIAALRGAGQ